MGGGTDNQNPDQRAIRKPAKGHDYHRYVRDTLSPLFPSSQPPSLFPTHQPSLDVREPHELAETGRIPGARSMPLNSNPDAISLPREAFLRRFGFAKPNGHLAEALERDVRDEGPLEHDVKGEDPLEVASDVHRKDTAAGGSVKHVVFYCKSGVRSASAAQQVMQGEGGWPAVQSAHFKGGWTEWAAKGGKVEKVE